MCVDGCWWARTYVYSRRDGGRMGLASFGPYSQRLHPVPSTSQSSCLTVTPRPQASVTGALGSAQRALAGAGSTHGIRLPFSALGTQPGCADLTKGWQRRPACQCKSWAEEGRTFLTLFANSLIAANPSTHPLCYALQGLSSLPDNLPQSEGGLWPEAQWDVACSSLLMSLLELKRTRKVRSLLQGTSLHLLTFKL